MTHILSSWKGRAVAATGGVLVASGLVVGGLVATSGGAETPKQAAPVAAGAAAAAMPAFRLPFPCGQKWRGDTVASSAHTKYEIDFNQGPDLSNVDEGKTVVASAAGTVIRSTKHVNQSGYGNHVVIQHSGGYQSWYAHLKSRSVKVGQKVSSGTKIGALGRTTKPSRAGMTAHLHYEVRKNGQYPPVAAYFSGKRFPYPAPRPGVTLTACKGGTTPPPPAANPVAKICGKGFKQIDKHALGKAATVYLGYSSASKGTNCVITVKKAGAKVKMSATLQGKGGKAKSDAGNFTTYAGPVKTANLGNKCVRWGGSIGSTKWLSGYGHCG
ncbi:M23 family metallopeptidase [Spirillospora sp. NPDC047279]|uniref:M23 family metallopeptidase n=1 Tax=Spirillospora sp. NPDC047279 TaxID=3155478 RepID=UPI0033CD87D3